MNISPISFQGIAYFSKDATKHMTAKQKERIEKYAAQKPDEVDIFVAGQKLEDGIKYNGKFYGEKEYLVENENIDRSRQTYCIKMSDGTIKEVKGTEVKVASRRLPIFNAYIFSDCNKVSLDCPICTKEFDFRNGAVSLIKVKDSYFKDNEF